MSVRTYPVPRSEFQQGIHKCIENADELLDSAISLLNNHHYTTCTFLAIQASEEYGKALLLTDEFLSGSAQISRRRWKRVYCKHQAKLKRARRGIQEKVYKVTNHRVTISWDGRGGRRNP